MTALKVGITGGIGAGKSIVSQIFEHLGYPVFNSDQVAKDLMVNNSELKQQIIALFGEQAYENNQLNRAHLSAIVFKDKSKIEALNQIVHPAVRAAFDQAAKNSSAPMIFNEAAILYETGAYKNFDHIILVTADEDIKIQRTMARDKVTEEAVKARLANQMSDAEKRSFAPFEIINDGSQLVLPQVLSFIANYSTSS
ncbi:dephospho-CoA kinase [Lishizhenia tianjinensis]|uniref:Dephospho-CoA kinase n=1 Tax=Lishizhenia tianjinensis TaxID=477690 RepID=A0A1I6YLY8_9FLAO|nr:dephospho-CoA kinase [Lishizhenia tianjinensis]SFT51509.1 dephospho-CoA kinase [Lishizhenia tianjinensis]